MFEYKYRSSDEMNYPIWFKRSTEELKWVLWPRRCYESNRVLWLELAYRSRNHFRSGDTDFITEDRWFGRHEFLIVKIKYAEYGV